MGTPARITGVVVKITENKGTSKAGNAFHRRTAVVMTGADGTAEVGGQAAEFSPREGDLVDWSVDADVFSNRLSFNHMGDFDTSRLAELAKVFAVKQPAHA